MAKKATKKKINAKPPAMKRKAKKKTVKKKGESTKKTSNRLGLPRKRTEAMSPKGGPKLASAIFCNSVPQSESGKKDCRGIFTSFLAWAYPTSSRSWFAILTLYDLPLEGTTVAVSISREGRQAKKLQVVDISRSAEDVGSIIVIPLRHSFEGEGRHFVHFNVVGTKKGLKIPTNVVTRPWAKFSKKELLFLKENPSTQHAIRINVLCSNCSNQYVFEENVLAKEDLVGNILPFPDSGLFECGECAQEMRLKDIQGQLRSSIKTAITSAKRRGN